MRWLTSLALATILLAGCASSGRKFDTTHVHEVRDGVHTKSDIRRWFGEPYDAKPILGLTGGVERWTYLYAHSTAGVSTTADTLVVDFDAKGTVCDHAYVRQ